MAILTNMSVPVEGGNTPLLMPKLQNRFRVTFDGLDDGNLVTGNVVSVTRPTLTFDDVTLEVYNSRVKLPGKHAWSDVTLVIRDDISGNVVKQLDRQLNKQIDMAAQSTARSGSLFKFNTKIETLDGSNGSSVNSIDTWVLSGSFIQNIEYGNNDYSTSDAVQISVTIRYDSASHVDILEADGDTLSGQFVNNIPNAETATNSGSEE